MSQMPKWQNLFVVNLPYPELCDSPLLWLHPVSGTVSMIRFHSLWNGLAWQAAIGECERTLECPPTLEVNCGFESVLMWASLNSRSQQGGHDSLWRDKNGKFLLWLLQLVRSWCMKDTQWWWMWWKSSSGCDDDFKSTCTQCSYCSVMLTTAGGWCLHL